jgi:hypothetical protein
MPGGRMNAAFEPPGSDSVRAVRDEMPPTAALRANDPPAFRAELHAVLTEGVADWERDWRDLLVALAPFHDCARRLGLDVAAEFDAAAAAGPPSLAGRVRTFGRRDDVTLDAFGHALEQGPDGPRYVRKPW